MELMKFIPDNAQNCTVTACLQPELTEVPGREHAVMVVCPGGGYESLSQREAEPVAKKYYAAGYSTFILEYSVGEGAANFQPLSQLAATVAHIRRHAEELHIDPKRVAVCGFSAGGHLAASLGVLHNDEKFLAAHPQTENIRPDAVVLSYPVITADELTHPGSLQHVSGNAPVGSPEYTYWGLNIHVDSATPPMFLWHTSDDELVPVENSLRLSLALSAAEVPYELHVLPHGAHGLSVCSKEVNTPDAYNGRWVEWSIQWLSRTLNWED